MRKYKAMPYTEAPADIKKTSEKLRELSDELHDLLTSISADMKLDAMKFEKTICCGSCEHFCYQEGSTYCYLYKSQPKVEVFNLCDNFKPLLTRNIVKLDIKKLCAEK